MSSRLLDILGRAFSVDTPELIWAWLDTVMQKNQSPAEQKKSLEEVVRLLRNNKIDSAEEQLRVYLFDNPSCSLGRLAAAAICIEKGQIDEAVKELNSVYMRQPSNTLALYVLGHCYERKMCESEALSFYQDCLKFKSYLQLPRYRLAAIYLKNGQLEKTIQEYEILRKEFPDDISILTALGNLYTATGRFNEAVEIFNTAILIHPDNFNSIDENIEQLINQGEFEQASQELEALMAQFPERADLLLRYGDVLGMLGLETEALAQYESAVELSPDCLEASIKLGTAYLQNSEYDSAARQFNKALEINNQIVDAYIGLSFAYKAAQSDSEASDTLSLAAAIEPNSSLLFTQTAVLHLKNSLSDGTDLELQDNDHLVENLISAMNQQLQLYPNNPDLHYRLGIFMMYAKRLDVAVDAFATALNINPTFYRARNKLAICLVEADKNQQALEVLAGPDCLDKGTLDLHYKTSLLFCDKFKFACSLLNLENLMQDNFADSNAASNISIVLQNLGLIDKATFLWENLDETIRQAIKML